jgi:hypothetical protein
MPNGPKITRSCGRRGAKFREETLVIYHHSITAAAARERVAELMAQAARDGGARPKTVRARRSHRWLRVPSWRLMPAARAFKRSAA